MGEAASRKMDMEELMRYSDNLIDLLKDDKDIMGLRHFLSHSQALQSQCHSDFNQLQISIQDYEKKIEACKKKRMDTESETVSDAELDALEKAMEEEKNQECMLSEELRVTINAIDDFERQRASLEEQRQTMKNVKQDELKAEMKLSMYASVTNIIPQLDNPSKISGYIVARDKNMVENFDFDPSNVSAFDSCNGIWKMINL